MILIIVVIGAVVATHVYSLTLVLARHAVPWAMRSESLGGEDAMPIQYGVCYPTCIHFKIQCTVCGVSRIIYTIGYVVDTM